MTNEGLVAKQLIKLASTGDAKALRFLIDRSNKNGGKGVLPEFRFIIDGLDMTPKPPNDDGEQ